jgi:PIN domain nuclease of toxin-antitoxin system
MNLLLDTHVLIWWLEKNRRLGTRVKKMLEGGAARPVVSAVSIWEMAIKMALGRLEMSDPLEDWMPRLRDEWGVRELPISFAHAAAVRSLPARHSDPFDRMLVAQAQCEGLTVVTGDSAIGLYDVRVVDAEV